MFNLAYVKILFIPKSHHLKSCPLKMITVMTHPLLQALLKRQGSFYLHKVKLRSLDLEMLPLLEMTSLPTWILPCSKKPNGKPALLAPALLPGSTLCLSGSARLTQCSTEASERHSPERKMELGPGSARAWESRVSQVGWVQRHPILPSCCFFLSGVVTLLSWLSFSFQVSDWVFNNWGYNVFSSTS